MRWILSGKSVWYRTYKKTWIYFFVSIENRPIKENKMVDFLSLEYKDIWVTWWTVDRTKNYIQYSPNIGSCLYYASFNPINMRCSKYLFVLYILWLKNEEWLKLCSLKQPTNWSTERVLYCTCMHATPDEHS